MYSPSITVVHGELVNICGVPKRFANVSFVPARVKLLGQGFDSTAPLNDHLEGLPPDDLFLIQPGQEAPWVLGRLMNLFAVVPTPEMERPEKCCHEVEFIAVIHEEDLLGIPFISTDYYGSTHLLFSSSDAPPLALQARISAAFWGLLLQSPTDLEEYEERLYHIGASIWCRFGVRDGKPFMSDDD